MLTQDRKPLFDELQKEAKRRFDEQLKRAVEREDFEDLRALNNALALGPAFNFSNVKPDPLTTITVGLNTSPSEIYKLMVARKRVPESAVERDILTTMILESEVHELSRKDVVYVPQSVFGHGMRNLSIDEVLAAGLALGLHPFDKDLPLLHILNEQHGNALCAHAPIKVLDGDYIYEIRARNQMSSQKSYELKPHQIAHGTDSQTIWIFSQDRTW